MMGLLFLMMTTTFWDVKEATDRSVTPHIPMLKMSLWAFLFGVLIEWKCLKNIIIGNIKVNWLLIPALGLMIISFIPRLYWISWFGLGMPFLIEMFSLSDVQLLLNAFSGILLVRALNNS